MSDTANHNQKRPVWTPAKVPGAGRFVARDRRVPQISPAYREACRIRSTDRWQEVRRLKLDLDPVCQWCGKRDADTVHHLEPVAKRPHLAYDIENLMSVCTGCHDLIENAVRRGVDIEKLRGGL